MLGDALEQRLAKWIVDSWSVNLSPTALQIICKAKELAQVSKRSFKRSGPNDSWLGNFLNRRKLSMRRPSGLSSARRYAELDCEGLERFHEVLKKVGMVACTSLLSCLTPKACMQTHVDS